MTDTDVAKLSFEQAMQELENVIRQLEDGSVELEATLRSYERGVLLATRCETLLQATEAKVKELVADAADLPGESA
ncbi:MAG: exodeoxyribonuclease VII small subunit [Candidatus Dormibacteria bacterium]